MGGFLKSECPHCGQAIEFPAEGTGQTVACPTCDEPFVLAAVAPPAPKILEPAPVAPPAVAPVPPPSAPRPAIPPKTEAGSFEQAGLEFERDREFEKRQPTREQLARAWAWAKFQKADTAETEWPTHAELVVALKKLFSEFRRR
jgi:hypothetical protein